MKKSNNSLADFKVTAKNTQLTTKQTTQVKGGGELSGSKGGGDG